MKKKLLAVAAAVATLPAAYAVDFKAGNWDMSVGGNANTFYTTSNCKNASGTVGGLALGDAALACNGKSRSTTIGNGLLPNVLSVGAKTTQDGYDIAAVFGMGAAVATHSSIEQNSVVDVRNAYVTIGNKDMGTVKLGRDYGMFGAHAILNDMTLLGVGAATQYTQNGRVSLGHIGAGYTYLGTYGQVAYTSPSLGGVNVDVALLNPVDANYGNYSTTPPTSKASTGPAVQARATFAGQGFKAWAGNKSQDFNDFRMNATEFGASLTAGEFGLLANVQSGTGLGILSDGDQGSVKNKNTFVQATYKPNSKLKFGLGVGKSENDTTGTTNALKSNQNTTAGVYYNLTTSFTLIGEVGTTKSKGLNGAEAKQDSMSVGGIFFF
jgi:predicted porin